MRKMIYIVIAAVAVLAIGAIMAGCQSCGAANAGNDLRKCKEVPAVIADAPLLSYKYSYSGTMRWPLHTEEVERCKDDTARCVIRLFDQSRPDLEHYDENDEPRPDTLVVGSEVLDRIKQMMVEAKAWRFKDDYNPRERHHDGYSWSYSALFEVSDSMLAAAPDDQRRRFERQGGRLLSSGGCNAWPDTDLFEQVRLYLIGIYDSEKAK